MENSTVSSLHAKRLNLKTLRNRLGTYHYVAESSCCAILYRHWPTIFGGQIGEVWVCLITRHTNHFFRLVCRTQTEWAQAFLVKTRGFTHSLWHLCAFWGFDDGQLLLLGSKYLKTENFGVVNRHFKLIQVSSKCCSTAHLYKLRRSEHITDALISLHWLRVPTSRTYHLQSCRPNS